MTVRTVVEESAASTAISRVPLSHLSIEVGHLYIEDFQAGPERIEEVLRSAAPWERRARDEVSEAVSPGVARVSTCLLIDDYFAPEGSPRIVVPQIVAAADAAGLKIDYLAREAACAVAGEVDLARLVLGRIVTDPPRGERGRRPDVFSSGWLCNGERSADPTDVVAMRRVGSAWRPPVENGAKRHSIFVDVQLWSEDDGVRTWSCPYLASVWQLLRLGQLRHLGDPVVRPEVWSEPDYPERWQDLPPVTQLTRRAAPFSAFRTFSVLDARYLPIEAAVRTILSQVDVGSEMRAQTAARAEGEPTPITVPAELIDRITYAFTGPLWRP
jgi:hypothetical protein